MVTQRGVGVGVKLLARYVAPKRPIVLSACALSSVYNSPVHFEEAFGEVDDFVF